jgi:MurNAc alpha-1-phosphate uridylyltransferase
MVLAAGRGERMRPLTDERPKPLLEAGGLPLLGWQLRALARAGVRRVLINLGWLGEQIRAAVEDGSSYGLSVKYSDEGYPPLETGGGVFNALPLLGEGPFLVVNGDVWSDMPLEDLRCPSGSLAHLVLVPNPEHNPGGDFCLDGGRVLHRGPGALTFSGIGIYRAALFEGCRPGRFPLAPVLETAIRRQAVTGELYTGEWIDVGDTRRLERLRKALQDRARPLP